MVINRQGSRPKSGALVWLNRRDLSSASWSVSLTNHLDLSLICVCNSKAPGVGPATVATGCGCVVCLEVILTLNCQLKLIDTWSSIFLF